MQDSAPLFKLVTKPPHDFGDVDDYRSIPANSLLGREQQTERTCKRCGLVKITSHPKAGGGARLWRWGDSPTQFADWAMPECGTPLPEMMGKVG
ncbi:hypothetical protein [Bradyrhizobium sp.]|uniref:hypothetical protein n=1 Tax=Bradyrhizobium sp. TaxID=376 RepID=UPI003C406ECE